MWWRDSDIISASLIQKISAPMDNIRHIVLNQKLMCKSESGANFQVELKQNGTERYQVK